MAICPSKNWADSGDFRRPARRPAFSASCLAAPDPENRGAPPPRADASARRLRGLIGQVERRVARRHAPREQPRLVTALPLLALAPARKRIAESGRRVAAGSGQAGAVALAIRPPDAGVGCGNRGVERCVGDRVSCAPTASKQHRESRQQSACQSRSAHRESSRSVRASRHRLVRLLSPVWWPSSRAAYGESAAASRLRFSMIASAMPSAVIASPVYREVR